MIKIRLATLDEVETLNQLVVQSVRGLSQAHYSAQQIDDGIRYVFGIDTQLIGDQTYYVIELDGSIAGCGGWTARGSLFGGDQINRNSRPSLFEVKPHTAKIRAFFISPDFARQGLGKQLLQHCEQQAHLAGFTTLELMSTLPGEKLYAKMGFERVSSYEHVLPNGTALSLLYMRKSLNLEHQSQPMESQQWVA